MDELKIRNFDATHPGLQFPQSRHVSPDMCADFRKGIAGKLHLPASATGLEIIQALDIVGRDLSDVCPSDTEFTPASLLGDLGSAENVYVNWYRFDDIDEMRADDFSSFFHDLWYPSSDDIEVFDDSLGWVLLVRHFGVLRAVRF